ncbi:hypothetical protein NM208_g2851 [Fusarium decemcellulare]|uniref:Uncharacterized protein n=1 Tax=Fusarium decemcellulare TaxID=57161 RepID=A0ACC1SRB9_9HYPO|nr:hypothetical protein NM208_g2851 [Fusarium decemcellulare]
MAENNLSFVISDGPKLQKDPQIRALIRKHAMKNVALTRKKRCDYRRPNVVRVPVGICPTSIPFRPVVSLDPSPRSDNSLDPATLVESADVIPASDQESEHTDVVLSIGSTAYDVGIAANIPSPLSTTSVSTTYELARSKFQVDLTDLSMLTNFNVGEGTMLALSADPGRLLTLLGYSQWHVQHLQSYLQFVPSRYGFSDCLTAATNCLLAKARSMLMPDKKNETIEIKLHMIALRTLQDSLQNETSCMSPEVLCASQLLGLHALLGSSQSAAWSHHVHGSIRLIKHRTPVRFKSSFDKALFAAHIGPIVFESLIDQKPCYLEQPHWMEIYQSLVQDSDHLTERSALAIAIRSQMIMLPRLWHDIDNAVQGPELFNEEVLNSLRARCHIAHQNFLLWMEDYKAHCVTMSLSSPSPQELATRRELYGTAIECLMIVKRLLAAIDDDKRQALEKETQALAKSLLNLHNQPSPKHSWLFAGHEVSVAQSIVMTKEQWGEPFLYTSEYEKKLASRARYTFWTTKLRPD